jgi:hypothetical protein
MGRKSATLMRTADSEVIAFMSEFARHLVAAGITSSRFADISRNAFYKAASVDARFRNKRLNQSAVAAMTGLTRVQVREFSQQERAAPRAKPSRVESVVKGWSLDPAFLTASFRPKRLSIGRRNANFSTLVRKYGGDVPARSVLRELVRAGCVTVRGRFVSLKPDVGRTPGQTRLEYLSQSLVGLLGESSHCSGSAHPFQALNREVLYSATSTKGRILIQQRSARSLDALMAELKAAGDAASIESPPKSARKGLVTRTRVVLLSEELNCESIGSNIDT